MSTVYHPSLTAAHLAAILEEELRPARATAETAFSLDDIETLLRAAEERSLPRTELPPQLNRFPFTRIPLLRRLVLKGLKLLFTDQRAVNAVLVQALREMLAVNRYLLTRLAAADEPPVIVSHAALRAPRVKEAS